ncbi:VOC family protein [Streptomyces sp. NPDC012888]|uniref:VOC family protein n=1 Tax=Streptomyces sp. NPDC012888 TaxID=3364855 RepID=UPI0036C6D09E
MLGTDFRTGSPNWLDLGSPDTAAAEFYRAVFGWEFVSAGPEAEGYGFFKREGRTVAALGPLMDQGAESAWMIYFQSPDIQATAKAVAQGGGQVRAEPMDVMGEGWLAQFTDPQGAEFAVWQPGRTKGLDVASETNTLCWAELHTGDTAAAIAFYRTLFGWRSQPMDAPGMTYEVLSVGEGDQQDGSFGGVAPLQDSDETRWVPYFAVADVDAVTTAVTGAGGSVLMPGVDVPDVGRIAWLGDRAGAVFAVLRPDPRMG